MKKFVTILISAIFLSIAFPVLSQGIWTYYTDELPGIVFDMTQDKYGNYWFATTNGVCELDTNGFWHYLVDSTVWDTTMYFKKSIVVDNENNKWFVGVAMSNATKEYVVKYDDSTFTYYNPSGKEKETRINVLGIDSLGQIWAGSMANWAYWFDGTQWQPVYVPGTYIYDAILDFGMDRTGKLYIGHENGISTLDSYLWGDGGKAAYNFSFDKDNHLWFGSDGWGLGVYDGLNWMLYTIDDGLKENYIAGVAIDSNYNIWISYRRHEYGASKFDAQQWIHLSKEDGLIDNRVIKIYVDLKGAVWFISINGISVYSDTATTKIKIHTEVKQVPNKFIMYQNFPNPFNSETTIHYELKQDVNIQLSVFNLKGKEVKRLVSDNKQKGFYQIVWNGKDKSGKEVSSGIYFYILEGNNFNAIKKMTLIR